MCGIWCSVLTSQSCTICSTISALKLSSDNENQNHPSYYSNLVNHDHFLTKLQCAQSDYDYDENIVKMLGFSNRRGPDLSSELTDECDSCISLLKESSSRDGSQLFPTLVHLSSNVLWTQGPKPIPQPYVNKDNSKYLLFNGDIYSFSREYGGESHFSPDTENDGLLFFNKLQENGFDLENVLMSVIGDIRGPYAFVYFDKLKNKLWFGRDFFGRQSLLFSSYENSKGIKTWNISSVSVFEKVFEIPTMGIYQFDLESREISLIPFASHKREDVMSNLSKFAEFIESIGLKANFSTSNVLEQKQINLSFSTKFKTSKPEECKILSKLSELALMESLSSSEVLIRATDILDDYVTTFLDHLRRSVRLRTKAISPYCKICVTSWNNDTKISCPHSLVGVLFSGGLDSTVIAYLAIEALESKVDLLNVAFSKTDDFNVPDRETALESFRILRNVFKDKGKYVNLVLINETRESVVAMRKKRVKDLISPLKSVIDDSVGCCLWFAASGNGYIVSENSSKQVYESQVRTVLIGSGIDELLGGYSRHRSAYERNSWNGLTTEMQFDMDRISIRNMGRDNRVVSDHGICPRMPFLDEEVVNFLTQECDIWVKCCPLLGSRGLGEKLLLRATAVKLFGKENVHLALFPKRAMQFGSRIAKLENSKEKGGDDCDRLL